jgi:ribonuclease T2
VKRRYNLVLLVLVLIGGAIAFWLAPQENSTKIGAEDALTTTRSAMDQEGTFGLYTLAVSWQPAFCETEPGKPECRSLTSARYDADHFALHGLWPAEQYCGVGQDQIDADTRDPRSALPAIDLEDATRAALDRVMPGTQSYLERHEWLLHGTCSGVSSEQYYARAISFVDSLNASAVRDLFARNVGTRISARDIRAAFDKAFGSTAGDRVRIDCAADGDRELLVELRIRLYGKVMAATPLATLINRATPSSDGCGAGIVDDVGHQ